MTAPVFGMNFTRPEDEAVPVQGADFTKMLLIEASEDATDLTYPIGTPVRISSSDTAAVTALGTGPLAAAVKAINDQLGPLNVGADITVVRVTEGVTTAITAASIATALGNVASIPAAVGATPRLIWAGRSAYRVDEDTTGPVVAALPAACAALLAIAIVDVDDTSKVNAIDARETMESERLMPVGVAARVYEGEVIVTRPMGPRVLGIIARVDNEHLGKPFDPFANQVVNGLAALSRTIPFSLLDGSTEGQQMLEAEVAIVTAGEHGVDGAASDGGFIFIGTDSASTGELWKQIHQVRGADYLVVKMIAITREFLGKKVTLDLGEAWLNSLKFMLRDHQAAGDILGYKVEFRPDSNSPEQIRLGHLTVSLNIEPAPAFKVANHEVRRYRPAIEGFVADLVARLNAAA